MKCHRRSLRERDERRKRRVKSLEWREFPHAPTSGHQLTTFLLAFGALFSIVNPLSGAFIFFGATRDFEPRVQAQMARWVAIYAFAIMAISLYVGAYVLSFFGVSIPVLRVAGGIIVAMTGWAPHPDQQQPLKPGSAKMRLADALGVQERSAGEKPGE